MDYSRLRFMSGSDVIKELCKIFVIGTWTAEVYALSSLGRADVFPSRDLAPQEAAKVQFKLNVRPNENQMRLIAAK